MQVRETVVEAQGVSGGLGHHRGYGQRLAEHLLCALKVWTHFAHWSFWGPPPKPQDQSAASEALEGWEGKDETVNLPGGRGTGTRGQVDGPPEQGKGPGAQLPGGT